MSITICRLLFDFGLVVLIWMIQQIVYPSFLEYSPKNLVVWHKKYVNRLTPIVFPLMLGQLGITIYQVFTEVSIYSITSLLLILLLWIVTFWIFVPIHTTISKGTANKELLQVLVTRNWMRTIAWTFLFAYSFIISFQLGVA